MGVSVFLITLITISDSYHGCLDYSFISDSYHRCLDYSFTRDVVKVTGESRLLSFLGLRRGDGRSLQSVFMFIY